MTQDADRKGATAYPRAVLDLFDAYVHGAIDRRGFVTQCAVHVGSAEGWMTPEIKGADRGPDSKMLIFTPIFF